MITTIAGTGQAGYNGDNQLAIHAQLNQPTGVFQFRNEIYISDFGNHKIRKISQDGTITTLEMKELNSDNTSPRYSYYRCAISNDGRELFTTCHHNDLLRRIDMCNGTIETIEFGTEEALSFPAGVCVDEMGRVVVADFGNHCVKRMDQYGGHVETVVGIKGVAGFEGDVVFEFEKYPHVGRRRKQLMKPFSNVYSDMLIHTEH